VRLGLLYYDGNGVKKDLKKSLALFEKGCDIGKDDSSATGCNSAAEQLRRRRRQARQEARRGLRRQGVRARHDVLQGREGQVGQE
jgi:TPR repeat protein